MSSFYQKYDHLRLPLKDILTATNNFSKKNIVRRDGFGYEYKGKLVLSSGQLIDILARKLDDKYEQGSKEFQTEIMMLSSLNHQNIVSIVGFCDENDEKIVINKFEAKGNLYQYLSDPVTLTWTQRLQICLGIARALSYIHYDNQRSFSVIHRDVKSYKILLGDNWEPKLSGFELSIMQPAAKRLGLILDVPCGTPGYWDPTYIASSTVNHKSDIYSFGVVLFEVLTGRKTDDTTDLRLSAKTAKSYYENGNLNDMIRPDLQKQMDQGSLKKFSEAAYCCLNDQRTQRPHIDQLIFALDQALKLQLAYENSLVLKEHSTLAVEGTSTNYWKGNHLEHLKIGFDAIKSATENFAEKYFIGKGGYGWVYKAELEHFDSSAMKGDKESKLPRRRSTVAIKYIINREDKHGEQGFFTEIDTLSNCKHPNIVSLLGFCYEPPHMILVYEHVSKGSLDDYLGSEGKMTNLSWEQRIKICIDIARGLDYIHTIMENKQKIIHRDIKSDNILLTENWEAKIADFGLSIFHPIDYKGSTINATKIAGTQVYLDPEYETTGKLKKESDVYSYGVVLFEILSGKLAYDSVYTNENEKGLAPNVRQHFEKGTINEIVDPSLKEENAFTLSKGPNQDSLNTYINIGHRCLAEKQTERPTMKVVIEELVKALNYQETHKDSLLISFEDIKLATQNFNTEIGRGGFGITYKGEIRRANGSTPVAVKRYDKNIKSGQGEKEFLSELEILFEYKHENIIGLIGYCNENNEKILVYEYASNGSLDRHVNNASLMWTQRLKIGIDVAIALDFLHGGASPVIHRDIKSGNILLQSDWNAKITDFGLSMIAPLNNEIDFVVDYANGTNGYFDPQYKEKGFLTRESDIYSLGLVLSEMMCGRTVYQSGQEEELVHLVKRHYENGGSDGFVFEGIKDTIMPNSLIAFLGIAYQCLNYKRENRPTAGKVVLQLKKALEFQEDYEIWKPKLPRDYKEIIQMSEIPEILYNSHDVSHKDLFDMFFKGIRLQNGKVCFSLSSNGERNELVSSTTFSYLDRRLHKRRSIQKSRFQRVVKMVDISNLRIQIMIKTQFLSPNVIYGAYVVFKVCDTKITSNKLMYVNLKYQMESETRHAYFATCGDDDWMMIELCRFIPHKKDVHFEVLLESLSRYYCGSSAIYVEGLFFRAVDDATLKAKQPEVYEKLKGVQRVQKSNSESRMLADYHEITQLHDNEKVIYDETFLFLRKHLPNMSQMVPAKKVLCDPSNVKCFKWKSVSNFRFPAAELLPQQVLRIKCKIEPQKLLPNVDYTCHLVFELSQNCHGLQCPVKVRDVLLRKKKEFKVVYFRSPRLVNFHGNEQVPKQREDGLMEVIVWEFNSGNNDHVPMSLKLICYEGTMSGLIVYGIEFRPRTKKP